MKRNRFLLLILVLIVGLAAAACGGDDNKSTGATGGTALVGLFRIAPGQCADAGVTAGSYFRMVQSGGTLDAGPFVPNGDSQCGDQTWSPLFPGTDGGLKTGAYQPQPEPPFGTNGGGTAAAITQPTTWFAVGFALATNQTDPQTAASVDPPSVTVDGSGKLSADTRSVGVAWNGQQFNQGAPKPDGSVAGNTRVATGTYDASTGSYTLEWTSQISGGPFDGFTGVWHLEGTFEKS